MAARAAPAVMPQPARLALAVMAGPVGQQRQKIRGETSQVRPPRRAAPVALAVQAARALAASLVTEAVAAPVVQRLRPVPMTRGRPAVRAVVAETAVTVEPRDLALVATVALAAQPTPSIISLARSMARHSAATAVTAVTAVCQGVAATAALVVSRRRMVLAR